ncbi:Zn-dependent hydrolase [Plantactinospora sp. WMMC1484]|uniref:Zn-dependent hydrolase n=1 Tax=Plantactinospora sp. WMMC1484 TaxID=3404122 RepID=UPI003BF5B8C7
MTAQVEINSRRLLRRLRALANIGRQPAGGISRPGFGAADIQANRLVSRMARDSGLVPSVDAGGNLLIRHPTAGRTRPALLVGSHLDTVVNGGWLDGAYGVMAALEVSQACWEADVDLGFDLVVVAFANEEGALFPQPFWGSMVIAGMLDALPKSPTDYHGTPLGPALAELGGNLDELETAVWPAESILGYLELHIEQGPVLERLGRPIGVVDAIVGRSVVDVVISGVAAHAGTTPMTGRRDAVVGAAHVILLVEELTRSAGRCQVATVGRLETLPNSANTVAGQSRLTVDLRDVRPDRLAAARSATYDGIAAIAARLDLDARCEQLLWSQPAATEQGFRDRIAESADVLGLGYETLSSGAGHDAQIMAAVAPVGMIFAPSIGGVSHVPQEDTAEQDLVAGARVLLGTVLRMARR